MGRSVTSRSTRTVTPFRDGRATPQPAKGKEGMAMTIVEAARDVTGGIDTHGEVHVAAALDEVGGLLGTESFDATPDGYSALLSWLAGFGAVGKVGVEGTGFLWGRTRPVPRPGRCRGDRGRPPQPPGSSSQGKSDPIDAVEAARAALSGRAHGKAKSRDGSVEAIRVLVVAKRSARQARVKALTQMRQLTFTAPDQLQCRIKGLPTPQFIAAAKGLRPTRSADPVTAATKAALSSLAHRIGELDDEVASSTPGSPRPPSPRSGAARRLWRRHRHGSHLARHRRRQPRTSAIRSGLGPPVRRLSAPGLLGQSGPASAQPRWRPPGQPALWIIVISRLASDPETQAYMERRVKEGRSKREVIRMLKRYVAREVYRHLPRG